MVTRRQVLLVIGTLAAASCRGAEPDRNVAPEATATPNPATVTLAIKGMT
jgi:hypothetical protein